MKNSYIAKRYWNLKASLIGQKADPSLLYHDLIDFSIGDPDLNTDNRIIEMAFNDALNGYTHYTESIGRLELREKLVKYYKERFGFDINIEDLMITTSACHAMTLALEATLDDGDEVIIPTPHFGLYTHQVELARGIPVFVETYEEENFQINIDRLRSKITNRTKGIILNTPNNPTGACISRENLEQIASIAREYDLLIFADDIYTIFSYGEPFVPIATLKDMKARTITIGSFSKDYCMTGWRIGYILANPDLIFVVGNINDNIIYSAPTISQQAAIHALDMRDIIQPGLVEEFRNRIFYAYERLKSLKNLSILSPMGTFYLFPSIKATGLSSEEVARRLLEEAHVLVIPGNAFGELGEGHLRLSCTLSIDKMKEAFDRMEKMEIFR